MPSGSAVVAQQIWPEHEVMVPEKRDVHSHISPLTSLQEKGVHPQ